MRTREPRDGRADPKLQVIGLTGRHLLLGHQAEIRATIADFVEASLVERSDLTGQLLVGLIVQQRQARDRPALRSSDLVLGGRHWLGCGGRSLCLPPHARPQMIFDLDQCVVDRQQCIGRRN